MTRDWRSEGIIGPLVAPHPDERRAATFAPGLLAAVSKPSLIAAILKRSWHYRHAMDSGALNRDAKPSQLCPRAPKVRVSASHNWRVIWKEWATFKIDRDHHLPTIPDARLKIDGAIDPNRSLCTS
jgi:hypothetical protein